MAINRIILLLVLLSNYYICVFAQNDTTIFYKTGKIHFIGQINNGDKTGVWYEFDKSGETINKIEIINNTECKILPVNNKNNIIEYYYGYFKSDSLIKHGRYYREDTKELSIIEGNFFNNKSSGQWRYYDKGKLYNIREVNNGKSEGLFIPFEENGKINYLSYLKNGFLHGFYIDFDSNNVINEFGYYHEGCRTGEWYFLKNGRINIIGNYYPDYLKLNEFKKDTLELVNKDNILAKELYSEEVLNSFKINDQVLYIKDGKWEYYSEDGKIIKVEFYDMGKPLKTKTYCKGRCKR